MNLSLKPVLTGYSALSIAAVTVFALTIAAVAATADGQALPAPGPGSELGVMLQAGANDLCVDNAGSVRFGPAPHYRGENAVRETSISVSSGFVGVKISQRLETSFRASASTQVMARKIMARKKQVQPSSRRPAQSARARH